MRRFFISFTFLSVTLSVFQCLSWYRNLTFFIYQCLSFNRCLSFLVCQFLSLCRSVSFFQSVIVVFQSLPITLLVCLWLSVTRCPSLTRSVSNRRFVVIHRVINRSVCITLLLSLLSSLSRHVIPPTIVPFVCQ